VLAGAEVVEVARALRPARVGIDGRWRITTAGPDREQEDEATHGPMVTQNRRVGVRSAQEACVAHIDVFKGWADTIRQDIDALKAVLESDKADEESRFLAGGALQYLISKMDLIPDWNEGIGVIDDVMVLRVCAQLTEGHKRGALPTTAEVALDRMSNESEKIKAFLGGPLYDKLKAYCAKLETLTVRGRTIKTIMDDAKIRNAFYDELDEEIKKTVPIVVNDPVDAELRLKSYLTHKLS
jgi:uncharacterized membrane protein YkvA (DUF1232 family)